LPFYIHELIQLLVQIFCKTQLVQATSVHNRHDENRSAVGNSLGWHMSLKHESISEKDLFYCFVNLELISPSVYVIPSRIVAKVVRDSHGEWLKTPGQKGQKHNDTEMRRIKNDYGPNFKTIKPGWMDKYLEAWELLD
jgi:hypothetical protein